MHRHFPQKPSPGNLECKFVSVVHSAGLSTLVFTTERFLHVLLK